MIAPAPWIDDLTGRGWLVTDLGSTNGTWIDGVRMTAPQYLQSDQVLQLGQTKLRLMVSA